MKHFHSIAFCCQWFKSNVFYRYLVFKCLLTQSRHWSSFFNWLTDVFQNLFWFTHLNDVFMFATDQRSFITEITDHGRIKCHARLIADINVVVVCTICWILRLCRLFELHLRHCGFITRYKPTKSHSERTSSETHHSTCSISPWLLIPALKQPPNRYLIGGRALCVECDWGFKS